MTQAVRVRSSPGAYGLHGAFGLAFLLMAWSVDYPLIGYAPGALLLLRSHWMWRWPYVEVHRDEVLVRDGYLLPRARRVPIGPGDRLELDGTTLQIQPGGREVVRLRALDGILAADREALRRALTDDNRSLTP
ncbi:hypothetical protein [Pimelobacter sp. 30-1]|uniref:hypothetical protein n=1 Tax=Pimelobacter sp. 30-1 TaxID=2004991 RepID=UPI001C05B4A7|nr:hypothetical protein [Pimelobacter sp. 30-1]MBU2698651.1 hypothetical protein [Pimelobacter sp. 30-1]